MNEVTQWSGGVYKLHEELTIEHYGDIMTHDDGENAVFTRTVGGVEHLVIAPRHMDGLGSFFFNANMTKAKRKENDWCRMECKRLQPDAKFPYRKRVTDAGYDIFSNQDIELPPGRLTSVQTGIALSAPPGFYFTIEGRSGLGMKQIVPFRGIIDATYTGHLFVGLVNHSEETYTVKKYERIAQAIVHRQLDMEIVIVDEFSPLYDQRGTSGFGSSGK